MQRTYTGGFVGQDIPASGPLRAPSADRNVAPILAALREHMPARGAAVEFASGSGQHIVAFAGAFPDVVWTPTDVAPRHLESIRAWRAAAGLPNLNAPLALNVTDADWPFPPASLDATVTVNLLHLIGAAAARRLFQGIGRALKPGGVCFVYGPFLRDGEFVSDADRDFHAALAAQDRAIGYKDRDAVAAMAAASGLALQVWREMPANNLMLVARNTAAEP